MYIQLRPRILVNAIKEALSLPLIQPQVLEIVDKDVVKNIKLNLLRLKCKFDGTFLIDRFNSQLNECTEALQQLVDEDKVEVISKSKYKVISKHILPGGL